MKFLDLIKRFHNDESGAVTVDWVVLTAAVVGLGIAVVLTVRTGVGNLGDEISSALGDVTVVTPGGADGLGFED